MTVEELLKMLKEKDLDNKSVKELLSEALKTLSDDEEEIKKKVDDKEADADDEKEKAEKLFGMKF